MVISDKLKLKITKDNKHDFTKRSKEGNKIVYPRFDAFLKFGGIDVEFSEYEDIGHQVHLTFKEKLKYLKKRNYYGQDFVTSDGRMVVINHKTGSKGQIIITGISIF